MSFIATKRVGSVLRSAEYLSWRQAKQVLALLHGDTGVEIDSAVRVAASEFFQTEVEFASAVDALPPHPSRGPVYHSRRIRFEFEEFIILMSVSFTICMFIDVEFLGEPARPSQSKFWCSAIISGESLTDATGNDQRFAHVCEKIDEFSPRALEHLRLLYGRAVWTINPAINEIVPTGDTFSSVLFQLDDENFRDDLSQIERGKKLSEMSSDSALGLLNHLYSGASAETYLHVGRQSRIADCSSSGIAIDTILHTDGLRARALVIETRQQNEYNAYDWRMLGATSASEPVRRRPDKAEDLVYQLVHSPANVLSAEMAAEMGEQF